MALKKNGAGSGETINLLTWETYHEPEWLKEFKEETGIKVNSTNVGSPAEMFSKVKANPGQFDLILNTAGGSLSTSKTNSLNRSTPAKCPT